MRRGSITAASTSPAARAASATTRSSTSSATPRRRRRPTASCAPRTDRSSTTSSATRPSRRCSWPGSATPPGCSAPAAPSTSGAATRTSPTTHRRSRPPGSTSARRSSGTRSTRSSRARTSWVPTSGPSMAGRRAPPTASSDRRTCTDLWHVKKVSPNTMVHLTEKPVELARRAIEYSLAAGRGRARPLRGLGLDARRLRADRPSGVPHGDRPAVCRCRGRQRSKRSPGRRPSGCRRRPRRWRDGRQRPPARALRPGLPRRLARHPHHPSPAPQAPTAAQRRVRPRLRPRPHRRCEWPEYPEWWPDFAQAPRVTRTEPRQTPARVRAPPTLPGAAEDADRVSGPTPATAAA